MYVANISNLTVENYNVLAIIGCCQDTILKTRKTTHNRILQNVSLLKCGHQMVITTAIYGEKMQVGQSQNQISGSMACSQTSHQS